MTKDLDAANKDFEKLLAEVGGSGDAGGREQGSGLSEERKTVLRKKYPSLSHRR
jgi:hypothetical protein